MSWIYILLCILLIILGSMPSAWAQANLYPPPLSFSHAELKGRDFLGEALQAAEFSNANLERARFNQAALQGAIFSGSVAMDTNFHGADFSTGMLDFMSFTRSDLSDAVLVDTILLQSTFEDVDITGADFSGAILDKSQVRQLCEIASGVNSQTGVETRASLGCR